jgi:hypothetical protein
MKPIRMEAFSSSAASSEVDGQAIAAKLIDIAHYLCPTPPLPGTVPVQDPATRLVNHAEEDLRRRRHRHRHLPREIADDGVWTMLLDLYISQHRGERVSTKAACIAADAPVRSALRWLEEIEANGFVERSVCEADKRVRYVSLTAKGREAVEAVLSGYKC